LTVIIGLLGGIGSGKSEVASYFAASGAVVLDADAACHELLEDRSVWQKLEHLWGEAVFDPDGRVNRQKLGAIVFANEAELRKLTTILHPLVERRFQDAIARYKKEGKRLIVLDAPLLLEAGLGGLCDRLVFVHASRAVREERVKSTRGWNSTELARRESFQLPLCRKLLAADFVIDNSSSRTRTQLQVHRILKTLEAN